MSNKVLIIAEAGVNHNGEVRLAKRLIDVAADAGADIVKFQTFKTENVVTHTAPLADYQSSNTDKQESQFQLLKKLELPFEAYHELVDHCKNRGIRFLSTGFDLESLEFLGRLRMGLWKIPSGEITNLPYLEAIGKQREPIILSTGMSDLSEVRAAIEVLEKSGAQRKDISVLHCNTEYPTPFEDVNLNVLKTLANELNVKVGYSDHTLGIEVPIAAVAMGAVVIEKHFTLDPQMEGPDHKASLSPDQLMDMVRSIRNIEKALGQSEKHPTPSETKNRSVARKSLVARTSIRKGELFTKENLTTRRPGTGLSPMKYHEVLGTPAEKDYKENDFI